MESESEFAKNDVEKAGKTLVKAVKDFFNDNSPQWAAAIAYFTLFSLFPLLLAAVAIASYFVDPQWAIDQGTRLMGNFLPGGEQQIKNIVESTLQARGGVGIISLATFLWSGSRVFGVITKALNIAFDAKELYSFFKRILVEVLMTLTIGLLLILALSSSFLLGTAIQWIGIPGLQGSILLRVLQIVIPPALLIITVFLAYKFVPRRDVNWVAALIGAAVFTLFFFIMQPLFTGYIQSFADYNLIYGPLAIVVTLVLWTWLVSCLLLLGGELAAKIQQMWID